MKVFLIVGFAVLAVCAARPDDDRRPHPRPRGPAIFVRPFQKSAPGDDVDFKFGVAGMKRLRESDVKLYKIVKGDKGKRPSYVETRFQVDLRTLKEEEIKEWMDEHKEDHEDREDDDEGHPKPLPKPHYKHAIIGSVSASNVTCDDQSRYLVKYGRRHRDADEEEEEEGVSCDDEGCHPHPKPRHPGLFVIAVRGCPRDADDHHPRPHGPRIFVRRIQKSARGDDIAFKFGVAGMRPLRESRVNLYKIVKGKRHPEFVKTRFQVDLRTLKEDEVEEWMEEKRKDREDDSEDDGEDDGGHPKPHFKHAIVGSVSGDDVSCDDQGKYIVRYSRGHHDDDEEEEEAVSCDDAGCHPHPRPIFPGLFFIAVRGCRHEDVKFF